MEKNKVAGWGFQASLHLFISLGALAGGGAAVLNPVNPLGAPLEMLKDSPFESYLIPGIILFSCIGLGNLSGFFLSLKFRDMRGYASSVCGAVLAGWIFIQCLMLKEINVLHILFFAFGVIQGLQGLWYIWKKKQFPLNLFFS